MITDTVDASAAKSGTHSPVEGQVMNIPLFTTGFRNIPGGCLGFLNHQQYHWSCFSFLGKLSNLLSES